MSPHASDCAPHEGWGREGRMAERYDFVIVGGGSAGSALGNRLSADPSNRVLVLEAGRPDYIWDLFIHMPAALTYPIGNRLYDWKYESEPEPEMNGRRVHHARGKVLGGASSINGMIFQRGNPMDYERWAGDQGMETWDYAHCLPYFKKMETCLAGADEWRGGNGPLVLERGPATSPLFRAFFAACQEAGYPLTKDVNGYQQEGFAPFDRNIHNGRRYSAAVAYLHPVMDRPNLEVRTGAMVNRVLFSGTRATGVERKSTRLNSSHTIISYAVFCLKKKHRPAVACSSHCSHHPARQRASARCSRAEINRRGEEKERGVVGGGDDLGSGFFFNDTATTEIYTLSLHDALPI